MVLIPFPFTDLSGQKLRPALLIGQSSAGDLIVAFITSRVSVPAASPSLAEHVLLPSDREFSSTGLKVPSAIRLDKIATLHQLLARRRIGHIGAGTQTGVARCLRHVFGL